METRKCKKCGNDYYDLEISDTGFAHGLCNHCYYEWEKNLPEDNAMLRQSLRILEEQVKYLKSILDRHGINYDLP
ncbi:MAG TPA: hypothetical protein PL124_03965 [Candidatus Cloacimonadota bacterium]|nr:hypothetical protein [Candidatus Cloacimonadota bacterium]HPS38547.1 hypothetical protein [Candidatus Cloacimonadota bacterium]